MTKYYAGLDISMKKTYVVITDDKGRILRQKEVATEIADITAYLGDAAGLRVCLESGSLSHWLARGLQETGFDVVVAESHHMERYLSARMNKNDKNDAIGIAEALRVGVVKPVSIKSKDAQAQQVLIGSRRQLQRTARTLANTIRGELKSVGIRFHQRLSHKKLLENVDDITDQLDTISRVSIESLCKALSALVIQLSVLDQHLQDTVRHDTCCTVLQTIPGVGPVTAMTFVSTIDEPERFRDSRMVGAYLGLSPRQYASGEINHIGHISKRGNSECRAMLYEAAISILTRCTKPSTLQRWGKRLVKKKGLKKAAVAVARKLATIMHRMLITGELFDPNHKVSA